MSETLKLTVDRRDALAVHQFETALRVGDVVQRRQHPLPQVDEQLAAIVADPLLHDHRGGLLDLPAHEPLRGALRHGARHPVMSVRRFTDPGELARAAAAIFAIMQETAKRQAGELALIAAQDEIAKPSRSFEVERIG